MARVLFILFIGIGFTGCQKHSSSPKASSKIPTLKLSSDQIRAIKIEPIKERLFFLEKEAVGNVNFNENTFVQVFPPYQGKIVATLADVGDSVVKGQPLYTIDSPDLVQAESTLISSAATKDLTSKALNRAKRLYKIQAISQKDLEQAISDQRAAEGAFEAARNNVHFFGKTLGEISHMVAHRRIDSILVVYSPVTGKIITRNAQPGLFVQPGIAPAPYSVADVSLKWLQASVPETISPLVQQGQKIKAYVDAYPHQEFVGKITVVGETSDPNTHYVTVHSEIRDSDDQLRPGMLANFKIRTHAPVQSLAIPVDGIVREGDGTMTAWITTDRHHFQQRIVTIGLQQNGYHQILSGLKKGDVVVTQGALFLSNILTDIPSE